MTSSHEAFERRSTAVLSDPPAPRPSAYPDGPHRSARAPAEEMRIRKAIKLFHRGQYRACLDAMRALEREDVYDPRVRAFVAASSAMGPGGDPALGRQACLEAARAADPLPDVFCALGTVILSTGDRAGAYAAFRKGLNVDPYHPHLRGSLRSMGVRKDPVIRLLPRRHLVNRVLGALRARLAGA